MNIVGGIASLGEEWVDDKTAGAALHDHLCLRFDRFRVVRAESNVEVESCALVLMSEEREEIEWVGWVV